MLGVDRQDLVALALYVGGDAIARARFIGREPDHGDAPGPLEQGTDLVVGRLDHASFRRPLITPVASPTRFMPPWKRACSILTQRFWTKSSPPSRPIRPASSLSMPSWTQKTFAPILIASSARPGHSSGLRKTSTISTAKGMSLSEA